MKKLFLIVLLIAASFQVKAATLSTTVYTNNVFTNFPGLPAGPIQVKQILLANVTSNAQTLYFYDVPTNSLTNVVAAYTNTQSYLTNYLFILTNYYGNIVTNTNTVLFDNTNNAVAAITNGVPPKVIITVPAFTTYAPPSVNYYFYSGMWVSNATAYGAGTNGVIPVTITYQ